MNTVSGVQTSQLRHPVCKAHIGGSTDRHHENVIEHCIISLCSLALSLLYLPGISNLNDNCPMIRNINQTDTDGDGVGDVCDNCILVANTNQTDRNADLVGDVCETGEEDESVVLVTFDLLFWLRLLLMIQYLSG